jgi:hypothetical protein
LTILARDLKRFFHSRLEVRARATFMLQKAVFRVGDILLTAAIVVEELWDTAITPFCFDRNFGYSAR